MHGIDRDSEDPTHSKKKQNDLFDDNNLLGLPKRKAGINSSTGEMDGIDKENEDLIRLKKMQRGSALRKLLAVSWARAEQKEQKGEVRKEKGCQDGQDANGVSRNGCHQRTNQT